MPRIRTSARSPRGRARSTSAGRSRRSGAASWRTASRRARTRRTTPTPGRATSRGSWQIGAVNTGTTVSQRFVVHAAPGAPGVSATFSYEAGHPSDSSSALPASWVTVPGTTAIAAGGGDAVVTVQASIPAGAAPGYYTGRLVVQVSNGQTLRLPVFAAVVVRDPSPRAGELVTVASEADVFARGDTTAVGRRGRRRGHLRLGRLPVDVGAGFSEAPPDRPRRDARRRRPLRPLRLRPVAVLPAARVDPSVCGRGGHGHQRERRPLLAAPCAPASLTLSPQALGPPGRYYVAVNRAKSGGTKTGDFGAYVFTVDESTRRPTSP